MTNSVLVTGAGGFIGRRLLRQLCDSSHNVVALDLSLERLQDLRRTLSLTSRSTVQCDVTDAAAIMSAVEDAQPAAIVHLAAEHFIPKCESNPGDAVAVNVIGLVNTLNAAAAAAVERVVFASTADVYAPSTVAHTEDSSVQPSTVYGASKFLGERLVQEWARRDPARQATCVRIFNVYGPGDANPHLITDVLGNLVAGEPAVVGNLHPKRDFIHVDDVADILGRVLNARDVPLVLNVGTGAVTSVSDVLGIVAALRPEFSWRTESSKVRRSDRPHLQADTGMLRTLFPDCAPRALIVGLRDSIDKIYAREEY